MTLVDASPQATLRADSSAFVRTRGKERSAEFTVTGARCGGCLAKIERAVRSLDGVETARLNLSAGRLTATWSAPEFDPNAIPEILDGLGYPTRPFDPEIADTSRKRRERQLLSCLGVAGFASANIMLLSVSVWAGVGEMMDETRVFLHWISAAIAIPAVAYAGRPFFTSALQALRSGHVNMDVPISLAVILSVALSLYETILGGEHAYFDAAVMLLFFLLIGRFLDARLQREAHKAAEDLAALQLVTVSRFTARNQLETVAARDLAVGDTILLSRGERLPVDVEIIDGRSDVDLSLVNGESVPASVSAGQTLYSGAMNLTHPLRAVVKSHADDSLLSEIGRLLDVGEQKRSAYRQIADKAASLYVPIVHTLAALAFTGWFVATGDVRQSLFTAISVLVITCPCALGLAAPVVQVVAAGRLFDAGVYLKSGDALERIAEIDHVVFDKTGTLTSSVPHWIETPEARSVLQDAARLARFSRHPYSCALNAAAGEGPVADDVNEHPGLGVEGLIDGIPARFGSAVWVLGESHAPQDLNAIWFQKGEDVPVPFLFEDEPLADHGQLANALAGLDVSAEILSGDAPKRVRTIADKTGISTYSGAVSPVEKADRVKALTEEGRRVLMVGDGLNDAGALASAHASLAPGGAIDITRSASDCVYSHASLLTIPEIIRLSRSAKRRIQENFGLAVIYNCIAVPIALAGLVTPLVAAIAMSGSSIVVTVNALRIKRLDTGSGS